MANPIRGEVEFEAGGNAYALVLDFNALCTLEQRLELEINDIIGKLSAPTMAASFVRSLLWAGLERRHPALDEIAAGDIVGELGIRPTISLVLSAFAAAFPKAGDVEGDARPRKPASRKPPAGTSSDASSPGAS